MKKMYYLSTCSTCSRIIRTLDMGEDFEFQDIKYQAISTEQIDEMKSLAGTYEALFSRKAQKYRKLDLHEKSLTEKDYKNWILKEYTFLKRPVFIIDDQIFIGNSQKVIDSVAKKLGELKD